MDENPFRAPETSSPPPARVYQITPRQVRWAVLATFVFWLFFWQFFVNPVWGFMFASALGVLMIYCWMIWGREPFKDEYEEGEEDD